MKYKAYTLRNLQQIPEISEFTDDQIEQMKTVAHVLPFKTNNYVCEELINWDKVPEDPIFQLTFPQYGMLKANHYHKMQQSIISTDDKHELKQVADSIRMELNPHPAGQVEKNIPTLEDQQLMGMQHKYNETVLFFPKNGQTCHAYCTFCFRWPQFTNIDKKFAMRQVDLLIQYVRSHPEITDILITGGDPMVMSSKILNRYIEPIIEARIPHLRTIRIGSKTLTYWPYRYISDKDSEDVLATFRNITDSGLNLSFMAHFNHYQELQTDALEIATKNILETGAQIRTQSPVLRHINNNHSVWSNMWRRQVDLGMIPYYMFLVRDTGAQHHFAITLLQAWRIFRKAYQNVSGICRTVRGPSMSTTPGKIEILGPTRIFGKKAISLRFIQGRNASWVGQPFHAKFNPQAIWLDDLEPLDGKYFFFEEEKQSGGHIFRELSLSDTPTEISQ